MPGVTGYYEPLAEQLAELRHDNLPSINAGSWSSGHTGLDRPYYDEFRPLLRRGQAGVPLYQPTFATRDFFAPAEAALPSLELYLRELLRTARRDGRQPVLKFCRSLGRIGWMRRHFPEAVHAVVIRDPFSQFASSLRQYVRNGNTYFLAMPLLLLTLNRELPLIDRCVRHLGVELPTLTGRQDDLAECQFHLRNSEPAGWYRGFLAFWIAAAATIPDDVDLIIDSDALAHADGYRTRCENDLARLTGRMPDFSDVDVASDDRSPEPLVIRGSGILRAHAGAEAFLAEAAGPLWADQRVLGHVARKLAQAKAHALGDEMVRLVPRPEARALPWDDMDLETTLFSAIARATRAEREVAALRSSRSWRVTAPLRWLREALG